MKNRRDRAAYYRRPTYLIAKVVDISEALVSLTVQYHRLEGEEIGPRHVAVDGVSRAIDALWRELNRTLGALPASEADQFDSQEEEAAIGKEAPAAEVFAGWQEAQKRIRTTVLLWAAEILTEEQNVELGNLFSGVLLEDIEAARESADIRAAREAADRTAREVAEAAE